MGKLIVSSALFFIASTGAMAAPRCDGFAGGPREPGILIHKGVPCEGNLTYQLGAGEALVGARVIRPPRSGRFTLIGTTHFMFEPTRAVERDGLEIEAEYNWRGEIRKRSIVLRVMSDKSYVGAGGTVNAPPPGMETGRADDRYRH